MRSNPVIASAAKRSRAARPRLDGLIALAATGALFVQAPADAQTQPLPRGAEKAPEIIRPLLGAWDLEQVGAARKCTIVLGVEDAAHGRQLRFPATCRRALPVLETAMTWTATPRGLPILNDARGKALIAFEEKGTDAVLHGKGADGNRYLLDPKGYPRAARRPPSSAAETAAVFAQRPTVVDPSRAPAADSLPGRYAMMRQQSREACRIALGAGTAGRATAAIEGTCQDTGFLIFDPVGWRYEAGRLTLLARKGHSVELVFENGQWRKDPAVGAPLMLRKLAD
jgi:hypothetical protein